MQHQSNVISEVPISGKTRKSIKRTEQTIINNIIYDVAYLIIFRIYQYTKGKTIKFNIKMISYNILSVFSIFFFLINQPNLTGTSSSRIRGTLPPPTSFTFTHDRNTLLAILPLRGALEDFHYDAQQKRNHIFIVLS